MNRLLRFAVVAWLVGIALCGFGYWWSLDAPPPDAEDLRVERPEMPDEDNGWTYFRQAAEAFEEPQDTYYSQRLWQVHEGSTWDEPVVRKLLERNEEAFALLEKGLQCRTAVMPRQIGFDFDTTYLAEMRALALAVCLRARHRHRKGRDADAMEDAMNVIRFGHMVANGRGLLIHYLVGTAVEAIGCATVWDILPEADVNPDRLKSYVGELGRYRITRTGLADAYRADYEHMARGIEDLAAGKITTEEGPVAKALPKREFWSKGIGAILFQVNRTKRMLARTTRICIDNAPRIFAERDYSGLPREPEPVTVSGILRLVLSRNPVGRIMVSMIPPALKRAHAEKCAQEWIVSGTRVLMALKAYKTENGTLPASLDELVPEYIDAVPRDPYDGRPLRYSGDNRIIYSVGEDLKDAGGAPGDYQGWKEKEPTYRIAF